MHIKTNIEHSSVQVIVLAMCPLLLFMSTIYEALFLISGTILCLIISQFFILIFNKYLSNNVKAMLTAIISAMIVTIASLILKEFSNKVMPENAYVIVFSTTILNAEFIYFRSKAVKKHYYLSVLKIMFIFALMMFIYACVKEFLTFGSLFSKKLFKFSGFAFCKTIIFDLMWLASICAIFDYFVRNIDKRFETKEMVYQKYVKIVRDEKVFQYDKLRREKLLANELEINKINREDAEKLKQKQSENKSIDSVKDAVSDEVETVEPAEDEQIEIPDIDVNSSFETDKKSKKKKNKKGDK